MTDASIERELGELLGESQDAASRRAASQLELDDAPLALYGAGNTGRMVLQNLRRAGIEPVAFADDTPGKQGKTLDGVPIMSPEDVIKTFGPQTLLAITIFSPQASFLRIARQLKQTIGAQGVSFLNLAWKFPEYFLPYYQFELPQQLLAKAPEIQSAFDVLADDESRRHFVGHIRFRLHLDFTALPASGRGDYFPADVLAPLPANAAVVDCGAYDGDTVRRFIEHQRGAFGRIDAFEPDVENCARLRHYIGTLDEDLQSRIHVHNAAVGARRAHSKPTLPAPPPPAPPRRARQRFNSNGTMGANLDDAGNTEVDVVPVQEVLTDQTDPIYLKLDVEGAEREALVGAAELILRERPVIAVSIYHRPDDLW